VSHANARLTIHGRRLLVARIGAGHRVADVAAQLGCSRATAYKWLARFRRRGHGGPGRQIEPAASLPASHSGERRAPDHRGAPRPASRADWIAAELGMAPSTVGRVIARHGMPLLCELDALTGKPVRRGPASGVRYERERPGELVHIDVKKLGGMDPSADVVGDTDRRRATALEEQRGGEGSTLRRRFGNAHLPSPGVIASVVLELIPGQTVGVRWDLLRRAQR